MIGIYWLSDIVLSSVSAVTACFVFLFYLGQLAKYRSRFVYGLVLVSGSLFAESLLAVFMYLRFSAEYGAELAIPLMGVTSLTLLALISFAYVVRQRAETRWQKGWPLQDGLTEATGMLGEVCRSDAS